MEEISFDSSHQMYRLEMTWRELFCLSRNYYISQAWWSYTVHLNSAHLFLHNCT